MENFISPRRNTLLALLLAQILASTTYADPGAEREPRRAEPKAGEAVNFSLLDYQGKYHELRRADSRIVVLYFTSFGCPIARQSVLKLRALRNQFDSKAVTLWLVNSSPQDDPDDSTIEGLVRGRA